MVTTIETKLKLISEQLSSINRVVSPQNPNSVPLSLIEYELNKLQDEGINVLNLNYRLYMIKLKGKKDYHY